MTHKPIDFRTPENAKKLADALARHFGQEVATVQKQVKEDKKGA